MVLVKGNLTLQLLQNKDKKMYVPDRNATVFDYVIVWKMGVNQSRLLHNPV